MPSEWLDVMLEEVLRKREEADRARREQSLRESERPPGTDALEPAKRSGRRRPAAH